MDKYNKVNVIILNIQHFVSQARFCQQKTWFYLDNLGMGFLFIKLVKNGPFGNEISRSKLQNLELLHDFKEFPFENGAHILLLRTCG